MSRSYKKSPIFKDSSDNSHNKRYRRVVKSMMKSQEPNDLLLPLNNEITNQYDVCDYKFYRPNIKEAYRK